MILLSFEISIKALGKVDIKIYLFFFNCINSFLSSWEPKLNPIFESLKLFFGDFDLNLLGWILIVLI